MILAALPGLGPVHIRRLDRAVPGGAHRLLDMTAEERANWCPARVVRELGDWTRYFPPDRVERALADLDADFITFEEADFPQRLLPYGDCPVGLYRCRSPHSLPGRSLAVVGTRHPSSYGRKVAREFSATLCRAGFTIISGLAEGIDTEAHRAALASGGRTAAVLGGGLLQCYPASNRFLMEEIKDSAGVWTEFTPWRRADRRSFPQRNRIVSGVSEGVLVVESGSTGGSLITARMASEQGKPVYVVPGRIDAPESAGCHALIRDGAQLVSSPEEILQDLDHLPLDLRPVRGQSRAVLRPVPEFPPGSLPQRVWEALGELGSAHLDRLAATLLVQVGELTSTLLEMEVDGYLCRRLDGCYERA